MEADVPCFPRQGSKHQTNIPSNEVSVVKRLRTNPVFEDEDFKLIECLTPTSITEGMLVLGCIIKISDTGLKIALPGCLQGTVPITNISTPYNELLRCSSECPTSSESIPSLHSMFQMGESYPFKVLTVKRLFPTARTIITLSMNPNDINSDLRVSSLYRNMILHVAVKSIEDRGYIMDVGIPGLQGFITHVDPSSHSAHHFDLKIGQVIPALVKLSSDSSDYKIVPLVSHPKCQPFPRVKESMNLSLNDLLPGIVANAIVLRACKQGLALNCLGFDACVWKEHYPLGIYLEEIVSTEVTGTVLFVHPISHVIYLTLNPKPTSELYARVFFTWEKWDFVENAAVMRMEKNAIFFNLGHNLKGQVLKKELSDTEIAKIGREYEINTIHRGRVLSIHPMDNVIRMTLKQSFLNMKIIKLHDLTVGAIFNGKVQKFVKGGMLVRLSPNLNGFVRDVQMIDGPFTNPQAIFNVGTDVQCRVLSFDHTCTPYSLSLTCKKSLCDPDLHILSSYMEAYPGLVTKGVVVNISTNYVLLLFFNNVQGIVPHAHVDEECSSLASTYFKGQVLKCRVTFCKPEQKILHLSLKVAIQPVVSTAECLASCGLGAGLVTDVCLKSKLERGLLVQFMNSSLTALLPYGHLTDVADHSSFLGHTFAENDILRVLVFRTAEEVVSFLLSMPKKNCVFLALSVLHIYVCK